MCVWGRNVMVTPVRFSNRHFTSSFVALDGDNRPAC